MATFQHTPIHKNLWTSHFSYSQDKRYDNQGHTTTSKLDYRTPNECGGPKLVEPLKPADFHHKDDEKIYERQTEQKAQFYTKCHDPAADWSDWAKYKRLYKTNFKVHKDNRIDNFRPEHKDIFIRKSYSKPDSIPTASSYASHIAFGDSEKVNENTSETKGAFPVLNVGKNKPGFVYEKFYSNENNKKATPSRVMCGDLRQSHYRPTTFSTYTVKHVPNQPNQFNKYPPNNIVFGDEEKVVGRETENLKEYHDPHFIKEETDPVKVYNRLFQTNARDGDAKKMFGRSETKDIFTSPKTNDNTAEKTVKDKLKSFVPQGDLEHHRVLQRITGSTAKESFQPYPEVKDWKASNCSEFVTRSNVQFGHPRLQNRYYDTQTRDDYPPKTFPIKHPTRGLVSSVPLDYYKECAPAGTLTSADYIGKMINQPLIDHNLHGKLKKTNIAPPCGRDFYSKTSHKEAFGRKVCLYKGKAHKNLMLSSLPMGTMGKFIEGSYNGY